MVVGAIAIVGGLLYAKQDSLLYFPEIGGIPRRPSDNPRGYRSPQERRIPFQDVYIECADGVTIHAWLLQYQPAAQQPHNPNHIPTILFFHGNAGNIGLRLPNAEQMIHYLHANILLVEYRGYGHSDSVTPNEAGLRLDAEAAYRWCLQNDQLNHHLLFVFGRSLGGAVAFHLAQYAQDQLQRPLAGLIVENTFTSISDMVDHLMPFLTPIKPLVLKIGWDSSKLVPKLTSCPMMFLAGTDDQIVPHAHMKRLVELASTSNPSNLVRVHIIKGGTHNECWLQGGPTYWSDQRQFLHQAMELAHQLAHAESNISSDSDSVPDGTENALLHQHYRPGDNSVIPTMSTRLVDLAKDAMTHKGVMMNNPSANKKKE